MGVEPGAGQHLNSAVAKFAEAEELSCAVACVTAAGPMALPSLRAAVRRKQALSHAEEAVRLDPSLVDSLDAVLQLRGTHGCRSSSSSCRGRLPVQRVQPTLGVQSLLKERSYSDVRRQPLAHSIGTMSGA